MTTYSLEINEQKIQNFLNIGITLENINKMIENGMSLDYIEKLLNFGMTIEDLNNLIEKNLYSENTYLHEFIITNNKMQIDALIDINLTITDLFNFNFKINKYDLYLFYKSEENIKNK